MVRIVAGLHNACIVTRIGTYQIERELGRGGMGVVYLARDTRLERLVAIKALPERLAGDLELLARFEREAKIVASLNHPGIAAIYTLEEDAEKKLLVMEYVEGETLAARLKRGRLPVAEALPIAIQIAEALEAAHENGVIHRDLKPGNVMVRPDGAVKVLDFGLARTEEAAAPMTDATVISPTNVAAFAATPTVTSPARGNPTTIPGTLLGTAGYMSPEQARGTPVDKHTDIFSFGGLLYEMLTGRRAFSGETMTDSLGAILYREPEWDALPPTVGPAMRRLLARCLEKQVSKRYHDLGDVAHDLDQAPRLDAEQSTTMSGQRYTALQRRVRTAGAIAAIAVLGAVAFAVLFWRQLHAPPQLPHYEKLTHTPQHLNNARFAPDGRTVVYSAARIGNTSELFVWRAEEPMPRSLGGADTQLLSVSATGELAVLTRAKYLYHRTYVGTLARMPMSQATPREVLESVTAADWSPNGAELAIIRLVAGKSVLEYPVEKVLAVSSGYLSDLRISPDGQHVAFMAHDWAWDNRGTVVVIDRTGRELAHTAGYKGEDGLAWAGDGKSVYFTAHGAQRGYTIHALSLDGNIREVLSAPADLVIHDCLPSGKSLLSTTTTQRHFASLLAGQTAERIDSSLSDAYPMALSADGRGMLFTDESAYAGDNYAVGFRAGPDLPPVRLGAGVAYDLSPDGATVVAAIPSVPPRLVLYPVGAGVVRDISLNGFVSYRSAMFVPGTRQVLVCGSERGKGQRCYIRNLDGGQVRAVTPEGTAHGLVSPDAKSVVARAADGTWTRYPLDGNTGALVPGLGFDDDVIRWSADGRSLWVYQPLQVPSRIERLEVATGNRTPVWGLGSADRIGVVRFWTAVVSADEKSYAYCFDRVLSVLYTVEGVR